MHTGSATSDNTRYFQTLSTFLTVQNNYPATRFIFQNFGERYIDNQKVQVAYEITRDILNYLVSSEATDDA